MLLLQNTETSSYLPTLFQALVVMTTHQSQRTYMSTKHVHLVPNTRKMIREINNINYL
jgi:hypothetical protein